MGCPASGRRQVAFWRRRQIGASRPTERDPTFVHRLPSRSTPTGSGRPPDRPRAPGWRTGRRTNASPRTLPSSSEIPCGQPYGCEGCAYSATHQQPPGELRRRGKSRGMARDRVPPTQESRSSHWPAHPRPRRSGLRLLAPTGRHQTIERDRRAGSGLRLTSSAWLGTRCVRPIVDALGTTEHRQSSQIRARAFISLAACAEVRSLVAARSVVCRHRAGDRPAAHAPGRTGHGQRRSIVLASVQWIRRTGLLPPRTRSDAGC